MFLRYSIYCANNPFWTLTRTNTHMNRSCWCVWFSWFLLYQGPRGHQVSAVLLLLITSASGNLTLPFSTAWLVVLLKYYLFVNSVMQWGHSCTKTQAAHHKNHLFKMCASSKCAFHSHVEHFFYSSDKINQLKNVSSFDFFFLLLPANQPIFSVLAKMDIWGIK